MYLKSTALMFFLCLCNFVTTSQSTEKLSTKQLFIDSTDHAFDISTWMNQVYGVFPLVNLITEPAVGLGGALGLVHIRRKTNVGFNGKMIPPDITVLGGAYTSNNTWAAYLVYLGYWKQDKIRFRLASGYFSANLSIYREGSLGNIRSFGFNIQGPGFVPSVQFRIANTGNFLGVQYLYVKNTVEFDNPLENIPVPAFDKETVLSGLGLLYTFDNRDNTFTPNKGIYSNTSIMLFDQAIGSQTEYQRLDAFIVGYSDIVTKLILGLRFDYRVAFSDAPFYALPFTLLRGVPIFRYQGKQVLLLETEERWDFARRWSLAIFAGGGKGFDKTDTFSEAEWAYSIGSGIRYKLSRLFKLYGGVDIARGPENWAFYIQFGHYWNSL